MRDFWGRKSVVLITGASQNIGRAFAEDVAGRVGKGSLVILTSRSSAKLGVVRQAIYETTPNVNVHLLEWNLQNPDGYVYSQDLEAVMKIAGCEAEDFDLAMIVHNASMSSDLTKHVIDLNDAHLLQQELNVNVVSMLIVNSSFWHFFKKCHEKVIINLTSEIAKKATPSFGMPAISKVCRVVALDVLNAEDPDIKILHYNPGPVDTTLLHTAMKTTHDPKVTQWIQNLYELGEVKKPKQVVAALLDYLAKHEIEPCSQLSGVDLLKSTN